MRFYQLRRTIENLWIIVEARKVEGKPQNLLTIEYFQEFLEFEEHLMNNITMPVPIGNETADVANGEPPTLVTFKEICTRTNITNP